MNGSPERECIYCHRVGKQQFEPAVTGFGWQCRSVSACARRMDQERQNLGR